MRSPRITAVLFCVSALSGCAADEVSRSNEPGVTNDELIGGKVTSSPTTFLLSAGCTIAKVGPRTFLLAAHCVTDAATNKPFAELAAGKKIGVTNRPTIRPKRPEDVKSFRQLTIEIALSHPRFTDACAKADCTDGYYRPAYASGAPDVAVLRVKEESAELPFASIDPKPVEVGTTVAIGGYGCELDANNSDKGDGVMRYKSALTKVVGYDTLFANPGYQWVQRSSFAGSYFLTAGLRADPKAVSLCPGDSGGPVYRGSVDSKKIVGVNSNYSYKGEDYTASENNWHTRLDGPSNEVTAWLEAQGAVIAR